MVSFVVGEADADQRLDRALAAAAGIPRSRARRWIDDGLVDEVASLAARGLSRTAAQALGYKEILAMFDGRIGEDEAIDTIITRTRQFAVRQERWFRRDPRVRWIDIEHDPVAEATAVVIEALDT